MDITRKMIMRLELLKCASALSVLALASLLHGCGGGDQPNVEYVGTTLLVDTTPYERRTLSEMNLPGDFFEDGNVYVTEQSGQRAAVEARLDELGLSHERYEAISSFIVHVPTGWEDQWARALADQPHVVDAWLNFAIPMICCEDLVELKEF
jgi:hypothetical protein